MTVSREQAQMLATLAIAARPTGARRWDHAGVMAALAKVRGLELAEVMMACGRAARDRGLDTPAAIGNPSAPCWVERPVERAVPVKTLPEDRCGVCALPRQVCETAPRFADDEHVFEPDFKVRRSGEVVAQITAAVKAEIQPARCDRAHGDMTTDESDESAHDTSTEAKRWLRQSATSGWNE